MIKKLVILAGFLLAALVPTVAFADGISIVAYLVEAYGISYGAAVVVADVILVVEAYAVVIAEVALTVYGSAAARSRAAKAAAEARDKYNSNLVDRAITAVSYNPPWRVVYGNAITGGDIVAIFTSDAVDTRTDGTNFTKPDGLKHLVIHIATHQVSAIHDTLINGVRLGQIGPDGWALPTATGTGVGYSISSSEQIGATVIPVAGGTGTILVNDEISFVGDPTRYTVTVGCTGPGQNVTIAAPGLALLQIAGTGIDLGNEFAQLATDAKTINITAGSSVDVTVYGARGIVVAIETLMGAFYTADGQDADSQPTDSDDALAQLSFTGTTISNNGTADITVTYSTKSAISNVRVSYHLGAPGQTVDTYLNGLFPVEWDATHTLSGMAYVVVSLNLQETRFQAGPPPIAFDVSGAIVHDPRTNTEVFTNNPALVIRDFLIKPYGFSCQASDVDDTYTIAAANMCDTPTTFGYIDGLGNGQTVVMPMYTTNGAYTTSDSPEATLTNLSISMAGVVAYGGQWLIMPGAWTPSVMDLGDDDLDGQIEVVQAGAGLDTLFNGAHASYLPAGRVSPKDITPYQNAMFLAADGTDLWTDYTLPWTDSEVRCRSLVRVQVERNRNGLVITYPAKLKAWPLRVGDRVRVTSAEYGFALKYFRVTDWQFGISSVVGLTLQEDAPDAYDQADAIQVDPTPNTQLPNPYMVTPVNGFNLTTGTATLQKLADGTIIPRVLATWSPNTNSYVSQNGVIEISWQKVGDTAWNVISLDGNDVEVYITNILEETIILVRAVAINSLGVRSDAVFRVIEVIGKLAPPGDVAGFTVANTSAGVQVSWTPNTEIDYLETEVHIEAQLVWHPLTSPMFRGSANTFVLPYPAAGTYNFMAKHRDTSGNVSVDAASDAFQVTPAEAGTATWETLSGVPANLAALTGDEDILNSLLTQSISDAQTAADQANATLTSIASDNILSPGEKSAVIGDYAVIQGEKAGMDAEATAYGITTEKDAYDSAYTSLTNYLNGLTGWNVVPGSNITIDGPTFRSEFSNLYTARQTLLNAISSEAGTTAVWATVSNRPNQYRVVAMGSASTSQPISAGFYDINAGTILAGASRSYMVIKFLRSSGAILTITNYDVFGAGATGAGTAANMASDLNACTSAHVVVVYSFDEPQGNRMLNGLDAAMYRCGASRAVYGSPSFQYRSAYILIGIGACGEGQGFEAYHGAVSNDPDAWCDVSFSIYEGNVTGMGAGATPRTLADYSYTGDLNATRNVVSYQGTAPTSPLNGDLWFDTANATYYNLVGGVWQAVSDVTASKIAAGIAGQGALATLNTADTAQIAVGAVTARQVYIDSSGYIISPSI